MATNGTNISCGINVNLYVCKEAIPCSELVFAGLKSQEKNEKTILSLVNQQKITYIAFVYIDSVLSILVSLAFPNRCEIFATISIAKVTVEEMQSNVLLQFLYNHKG